jgi:hypothetical protein
MSAFEEEETHDYPTASRDLTMLGAIPSGAHSGGELWRRKVFQPVDQARRVALAAALLLLSGVAQAQEKQEGSSIDSEHIFGFSEGSDIGDKGESEIEGISTGRLGKQGGFTSFANEVSYRYGVEENFRASIGTLTDYTSIHGSPGLLDKTGLEYSGVISEFRWHFLEHDTAPIGLTLSFSPYWRRINDPAPGQGESFTLPVALLVDKVLIPNKLYAVFNATLAPTFNKVSTRWRTQQPFDLSAAITTAVGDRLFIGGEIRQASYNQDGFFAARALYLGPSLFARLSEHLIVKVAWAAQIPVESGGRMDVTNFERHQIIAQFAYGF